MQIENEPLRVDITPDPDLKLDADGDFKVPTYDIAPEDKHIADAILAMDPLRDIPSPFKGLEGVKQPELTLSSLPPELRESVERQLAYTPASKRPEAERTFVRAALEHNSRQVRTQAGVGEGALPFHQTMAEQAADHRQLAREFDSISERLSEVAGYNVQIDPNTNERIPIPVYAVNGFAREKLVREQQQLVYRMNLLQGPEGQRQLQKSLVETVELVKQRNAMVAEEAAVQQGAEKLARERRLQKRIETRARMIDADSVR